MSLFARKTEKRSITAVPWNVGGLAVEEINHERALRLVPVFAAIRLLADDISTLPLCPYRKTGDLSVTISTPQLLQHPSVVGNVQEWLYALVTSLASWGNAYGMVTARDGYEYPTGVEWLDPSLVTVDETKPMFPRYFYFGREVNREDLVHVRWFVRPGHVRGYSPIDVMRYSIMTGLGAMDYKADWFANGGVPPGTFKNTQQTVPQDAADQIKRRLVASIKRHEPIVHGNDWAYESISLPPDSAEFVATMKLTANQVASVYGVPSSRIGGDAGGSMTYASVEMESLDFVTHSLRPWLIRIEQMISGLLPNNTFVKFDTDALVRTDSRTRWTVHQIARQIGATSVNEIRAEEDKPPIGPEGDDYEPLPKTGVVPSGGSEFDPHGNPVTPTSPATGG